jgi:hypothetical protein
VIASSPSDPFSDIVRLVSDAKGELTFDDFAMVSRGRGELSWHARAKIGLIAGFLLAATYSALAVALWLLPGPSDADRFQGGILGVLLVYWLSATIAGPLLGICAPIARHWSGAAVLGFLGGCFVGGAFSLLIRSPGADPIAGRVFVTIGFATIVGAPIGVLAWRRLGGAR